MIKFAQLAIGVVVAAAFSTASAAPAAPAPGLTVDAVNSAGKLASQARQPSAVMLRAQILLDRAQFSPGEIDAAYGSNMRRALAGFQRARGLQPSGMIDTRTWDALNADKGPALVNYTITDADVAGPFQDIPEEMVDKAKLPALGFALLIGTGGGLSSIVRGSVPVVLFGTVGLGLRLGQLAAMRTVLGAAAPALFAFAAAGLGIAATLGVTLAVAAGGFSVMLWLWLELRVAAAPVRPAAAEPPPTS